MNTRVGLGTLMLLPPGRLVISCCYTTSGGRAVLGERTPGRSKGSGKCGRRWGQAGEKILAE